MGVRAFGITPYVVPADMEGLPWSAGALLYVRQEQPETLQPGDTIAYVTDSDLSLEGGVIGSVDTERRFFYVEGAPVYWDNVLGQPLWGIDGLGYCLLYTSGALPPRGLAAKGLRRQGATPPRGCAAKGFYRLRGALRRGGNQARYLLPRTRTAPALSLIHI